jgi:hypothetical protein
MQWKPPRLWAIGTFFITQSLAVIAIFFALWLLTLGPLHELGSSWEPYLPVWVPFGGALGGALISLVGVAMHTVEWNSYRYAYWHLLRPLLGMLSGSVAVIIVLFVLKGIFPDALPQPDGRYSTSGTFIMFVIAFVVGYREQTFRELVRKVVDVLLGPGDQETESLLSLVPRSVRIESDAGQPVTTSLTIFNGTKDTFSLDGADACTAQPDVLAATVENPETPLGPTEYRLIELVWTPRAPVHNVAGTVTVKLGGHTVTSNVLGTVRQPALVQPAGTGH